MEYKSIKDSIYKGYILDGLDLYWVVKKIESYKNSLPYYSTDPHRKTYFDKEERIYIKITEEQPKKIGSVIKRLTFNRSSDKYFKYYKILKGLRILTPKLLACINNKKEKKSIIITEAIRESQPMDQFLRSTKDYKIKIDAIKKLAEIASIIHKSGYYVSLDLRNILVQIIEEKLEIFILDLEHMKSLGFLKRRLKRNLRRARKSLLLSMNGNPEIWELFISLYKNIKLRSYV